MSDEAQTPGRLTWKVWNWPALIRGQQALAVHYKESWRAAKELMDEASAKALRLQERDIECYRLEAEVAALTRRRTVTMTREGMAAEALGTALRDAARSPVFAAVIEVLDEETLEATNDALAEYDERHQPLTTEQVHRRSGGAQALLNFKGRLLDCVREAQAEAREEMKQG